MTAALSGWLGVLLLVAAGSMVLVVDLRRQRTVERARSLVPTVVAVLLTMMAAVATVVRFLVLT